MAKAATATQKLLQPSVLKSAQQMELMGGDVDLASFHLQMRNKAGVDLVDSIMDATVDRTIDGASTLTVTVDDDSKRSIQLSGRLGRKVDVNVDGLWWTLVQVKKAGRQLTLVFEEREVNLLRYYSSWMYQERDKGTRAQFVLKMIQEVKEARLKWVIPELKEAQKQGEQLTSNQIIFSDGHAVTANVDQAQAELQREQGIHQGTSLTSQNVPATAEQIGNANVILATGRSMGANTKVLVSSIVTAIDESDLINLTGGDLDSVGLFQQRASWGSYEERHNPAVAAAKYFEQAIVADQRFPSLTMQMLCQTVQRSGTPDGSNYARYVDEGYRFVSAYGSEVPQSTRDAVKNAQAGQAAINSVTGASAVTATQLAGTGADQAQVFMRGTIQVKDSYTILTKENSWSCITRLANEVNWRAFCVSGTIYFISEAYLFKSKPFMTISEDSIGIDWIDYDYDEGKRQATVTVTCHLSRWSAPPGSTIQISNMGIVNGKWLVEEVSRSLYDSSATITLSKPLPVLPEPINLATIPSGANLPGLPGFTDPGSQVPGDSTAGSGYTEKNNPNLSQVQNTVVNYVLAQIGVPYSYGGTSRETGFDCSGLVMSAYQTAGIQIKRTSEEQWFEGPREMAGLQPGDLVFFGDASSGPGHVGMYIGNGQMVNAPHTGANVRIDTNWTPNFGSEKYIGATSPWRK
jgi:hypothetical protein